VVGFADAIAAKPDVAIFSAGGGLFGTGTTICCRWFNCN